MVANFEDTDSVEQPYFIAEAGVNHNGDIGLAEELVDVAADVGVDAVKFQTFSADRLVTQNANKTDYQTDTTGEGTQYEMLKKYELGRSEHEHLMSYCEKHDVTFLSTPFDRRSADMLRDLGVSAIKIGSGELDNHPFLEHVARFGLPLIVSTGMGTMPEVNEARQAIRSVNDMVDVTFLHCTSAYPCPLEETNLKAIRKMANELEESVGYSDHTTHPVTPALAVAAGATVVEKHFTLDSTLPGPDHEASLEPDELKQAVELVNVAATASGTPMKAPTPTEQKNVSDIRKSLHAATDLTSGTRITENHLDILRPANGLSPRCYDTVVGARTVHNLKRGEPLTRADVDVEFNGDEDTVRRD